MRRVRRASRALSRGLAGVLLAASAVAGAQSDMPAAHAPSAAELGVQTVQIPRAVMKDAEDAPQTLTAYWIAPGRKRTAAGAPVVVALHGCGGLYTPAGADANALGERYRGYAQWLAARGYAVVLPDSFGPRGKPHGICTEPTAGRSIDGTARRGAPTSWRRCAGLPRSPDWTRIASCCSAGPTARRRCWTPWMPAAPGPPARRTWSARWRSTPAASPHCGVRPTG